MRVVFLGTSEFGAAALRALLPTVHRPLLVITQPDRPAGRGRSLRPSAVKEAAVGAGLDVFQPESVNTIAARARIAEALPDVLVVVAFGQILRPRLLALTPRGALNVHASILPRHRGASPINAQILAGDTEVGVSLMRMDEGLDTGPVGLIARAPADDSETAGELHDRLALIGGDLLVRGLDLLERGELTFIPQDAAAATHAPLLSKDDGELDLGLDAVDLARRVRGFDPWPGARLLLESGDQTLTLGIADVVVDERSGPAGAVLEAGRDGLVVACGAGALRVRTVKPESRRSMSVGDWLNGFDLAADAQFRLPERDS